MPRYSAQNLHLPHSLHYSWTGWPSQDTLPPLPSLDSIWSNDGLQVVGHQSDRASLQITFEAPPDVSPVFVASRAKGRLQHALRQSGTSVSFSRKVSIRSLGKNITQIVETYIRDQLEHVELADPRYRQLLAESSIHNPDVHLADPTPTHSGRYWYNLHLVLVVANRFRIGGKEFLHKLRDQTMALEFEFSRMAIMPDHLHIALRGDPEKSPKEIGVEIQNSLAQAAGMRLWQDEFYVGTFSEYSLDAICCPPGHPSSF